ncbi:MAG TPA: GNAT family N-acetyltransferase [Candidatus Hydrogenedentes bacterium]|nr:GNAT family N-acetyltransferase [Candidatus Hydrogenedentota bacterium]
MNYDVKHITRDEIQREEYFCCMSGMKGRKRQCAMWSTIFDHAGSIGLAARSGDSTVGQLICMPKHFARRLGFPRGQHAEDMEATMVIACVNVHPQFRGQGIASTMVREAADFCRQREYRRIEAYVDPRPPGEAEEWIPSFSAFRKFGFAIEGPKTAWESKPDSRICYLDL